MDTEWSIAALDDDPAIVVPWKDEANPDLPGFVDLVADPSAIESVGEAREWPEVLLGLTVLNAGGSPVWTAKCDAWVLDEEEKDLDFGPVAFGFGVYFDIFPRRREAFLSLAAIRATVARWAKEARALGPDEARADFVVRPAYWDGDAGFAITLYVFGYGKQEAEARRHWSSAVLAVAALAALREDGPRRDDTMQERASSSIG